MTNVEKLEHDIAALSETDLSEFRRWYAEFDAAAWDRRLVVDDKQTQEAVCRSAHRIGRCFPSGNSFPGHSHRLCEVTPRQADVFAQKADLHRGKHSRLLHERFGEHTVQLADPGNATADQLNRAPARAHRCALNNISRVTFPLNRYNCSSMP